MNNLLTSLLEEGVNEQVFAGAAAAVACGIGPNRRTGLASAGVLNSCVDHRLVGADTLFDLASLSKALSTALLCFSLFAQGQAQPDDRLADILPGTLPADKQNLTLRSLLSHSAGLAAYQPWFRSFAPKQLPENRQQLLELILHEPLIYPPNSACLYSDLGFILLGHVLSRLTGKDLATNFREQVARPLNVEDELFYCPSEAERLRCAATEACAWRGGRIIQGEVHDEHCWLLGGVAGHAGLFGTATGVLRLCEAILDAWQGRAGEGVAWAAFVPQALRRQIVDQTWCMGFDTPSRGASSSGRYFSPTSVGHLGFTGTSFWIDPERALIAVLLSNRVHPSRENIRIRQFRPKFHDALAALTPCCS
jgi:CubicO group peptidase (beta-lactamase class C family)